ncbi:hypothetical protein [Jannaschia aquimarina]|uniref:N-acetyltransferase domain-containing protein n=1 Tax=Jannaschia aquimarina TaxID=935700 RepID=A0A0D1DCK6_9RHOB|nr:hypothetical protein [Jannaschia aquimarina]KIT17713.1 hypothetical protein jaqu_06040 [Jannaschia aquimarina]SNS78371.1 hypothetical protein SAMN05421775_102277 [Jannaschia aquimarina]
MSDTIDLGEIPPDDETRDAFLLAAGQPPKARAPEGFRGVAALWAWDRDMLVGQGVVLELHRRAVARPRLAPADWPHPVGLVELLCVIPEYRESGLEERLLRALLHRFRIRVPCRDALIWVGEARVPVLLSTLDALGPDLRDRLLR